MSDRNHKALSVDQLSVLYRLYLEWPESREMSEDREAGELYFWLREEMGDQLSSLVSGLPEIKDFVHSYRSVLTRARQIKSRLHEVHTNTRGQSRVDINTQVFFLVYDCQADPSFEGVIERGILLDIARSGMRIETSLALPRGTVLSLTAVQVSWDVRLYHLTGEVRWASGHDEVKQIGVSIFNIGDYKEWQEYYDLTSLG